MDIQLTEMQKIFPNAIGYVGVKVKNNKIEQHLNNIDMNVRLNRTIDIINSFPKENLNTKNILSLILLHNKDNIDNFKIYYQNNLYTIIYKDIIVKKNNLVELFNDDIKNIFFEAYKTNTKIDIINPNSNVNIS